MTLDEVKEIQGRDDLPIDITKRSNYLGHVSINGFIALPISSYNSSYSRSTEIEIIDENGNDLAVLVWTKTHEYIELNQLTGLEFICYLIELDTILDYALPFKFSHDYILIRRSFYKEYLDKFHYTSPIWGGFTTIDQIPDGYSEYKVATPQIQLPVPLELPHSYLLETARKSTEATTGLERFLKLYHLLELVFDYNSIVEIQSLNVEVDQVRIGKIFHEYKRDDVARLKSLLSNKINSVGSIIPFLNEIRLYPNQAKSLFYDFSKDSNPIKSYSKFVALIGHPDGFSEQNCRNNGLGGQDYNLFIIKVTVYWIYRIRCSIAHNKIGEYVMTSNDEQFVVDFGEPLLKEVIFQVFKK